MEKLSFIFPLTMNHDFQMVFEAISGYKPAALGLSGLMAIEEASRNFQAAVARRDQAYYESLASEYRQIEYVTAELKKFLQAQHTGDTLTIEPMAAEIFANWLEHQVRELEHIAQDIDREYADTTDDATA